MVRSSDNRFAPRRPGGYTLIEVMVVVSIVVLLAASTLPSVFALFNGGSDAQAFNLLSTMLTSARTEAIQNSTYTLVHVQFGDAAKNPDNQSKCWGAIFMFDKGSGTFKRMLNYAPQAMPGNMAFGRVDGSYPYVVNNTFSSDFTNVFSNIDTGFRTFSIIFSPTGSVITQINGNPPQFDTSAANGAIWCNGPTTGTNAAMLWKSPAFLGLPAAQSAGVTAVTLFDYRLYAAIKDKTKYLNDNGQFIALNVYTGQLLPRK